MSVNPEHLSLALTLFDEIEDEESGDFSNLDLFKKLERETGDHDKAVEAVLRAAAIINITRENEEIGRISMDVLLHAGAEVGFDFDKNAVRGLVEYQFDEDEFVRLCTKIQ